MLHDVYHWILSFLLERRDWSDFFLCTMPSTMLGLDSLVTKHLVDASPLHSFLLDRSRVILGIGELQKFWAFQDKPRIPNWSNIAIWIIWCEVTFQKKYFFFSLTWTCSCPPLSPLLTTRWVALDTAFTYREKSFTFGKINKQRHTSPSITNWLTILFLCHKSAS